jgi:hypothetical protein
MADEPDTPPTPVEVVKAAVDPSRLASVQEKLRDTQVKREKRYGAQR